MQVFINDDTPQEIRSVLPAMIREIHLRSQASPSLLQNLMKRLSCWEWTVMGRRYPYGSGCGRCWRFFVLMMRDVRAFFLNRDGGFPEDSDRRARHPRQGVAGPAGQNGVWRIFAMFQAVVLLIAIQAFTASNWLLLLGTCLLGSLMFSSVAMLVGSWGKDFLENLFLVMIFVIPLLIPAIAVLFPGASPAWTRFIPSFGVMQVLYGCDAYGAGIAEVLPMLGISVLWTLVLITLGLLV